VVGRHSFSPCCTNCTKWGQHDKSQARDTITDLASGKVPVTPQSGPLSASNREERTMGRHRGR
jgi:hypothetical protein